MVTSKLPITCTWGDPTARAQHRHKVLHTQLHELRDRFSSHLRGVLVAPVSQEKGHRWDARDQRVDHNGREICEGGRT